MITKSRGFISLIGLLVVGFLVSSLTATVVLIKNPELSLDLRNWASTSPPSTCAELSLATCPTINGCEVKTNTSSTSTPCGGSDCTNGVPGCSMQNQVTTQGFCECELELSTAKTKATCQSSEFYGQCVWNEPVFSQTCTGNKTTTTSTQVCSGTPTTAFTCLNTQGQFLSPERCDCSGVGSAPQGRNCCKTCASPTPSLSPRPSSSPNPSSSSNNSECSAGQFKCEGLGQMFGCRDGYWYPGTACSNKACNSTGTDCAPRDSCIVTDGIGKTRCKTVGTSTIIETCLNTGSWSGQVCSGTCTNGVCTSPNCVGKPDVCNSSGTLNYCDPSTGNYVSKACPTGYSCPVGQSACKQDNVITQSDCDKCLADGNTSSECQGVCGNVGSSTCTPTLLASLGCVDGKRQQRWQDVTCDIVIRNVADSTCQTSSTTIDCSTKPDVCNSSGTLNYCDPSTGNYVSKACPTGTSCTPGDGACKANNVITQADCDKCLAAGNTARECQNSCQNIGSSYCTPTLLARLSCVDGKRQERWQDATCSTVIRNVVDPTCPPFPNGMSCSLDSECQSGHCMTNKQFAAAHTGAPPAWNATTTCITAEDAQGLDKLANTIAIGSSVAVAPILLPAAGEVIGSIPLMYLMGQNALSTTIAGISPAVKIGVGSLLNYLILKGAKDCADVQGKSNECAFFVAPMANDLAAMTEMLSLGPNMISQGVSQYLDNLLSGLSGDLLIPMSQTNGYNLIGDIHSDYDTMINTLKNQGIIDEFGPTGKPVAFVGDYFGKNFNVTGTNSSGIGVFEYLQNLQTVTGVERTILTAGNWETRTALATAAALRGDIAQVESIVGKRLSQAEINLLASNPEQFASNLEKLNYVSVLPNQSAIVQHSDTAVLATRGFSNNDLLTLKANNPQLYSEINSLMNSSAPLTSQNLQTINNAQKILNISPTSFVENINSSARSTVTQALLNPLDDLAYNNLRLLDTQMGQELAFASTEREAILDTYSSIVGSDTFVVGHTPVSSLTSNWQQNMDPTLKKTLIEQGKSFEGVFSAGNNSLIYTDANLSTGMRIPFNAPNIAGVAQGSGYSIENITPVTQYFETTSSFLSSPTTNAINYFYILAPVSSK